MRRAPHFYDMFFTDALVNEHSPESFQLCSMGLMPKARTAFAKRRNVNRLPREILSYIFLYSTHSSDNSPHLRMLMPLWLSHVCSQWRTISVSTAQLWTTLSSQSAVTSTSRQRTVVFLERSKTCPLDLYLDFRDPSWCWAEDDHIFSPRDMSNILDLLLPVVSRWQVVTLLTDTWAPIHLFLSRTSSIAAPSMLREISLFRCNAYFVRRGQPFLPFALREPVRLFDGRLTGLRHVTLAGVHVDWSRSSLCNLRSLELKYHAYDVTPSLVELLTILRDCRSLERLALVGWMARSDNGQDDVKFLYPSSEALSLSGLTELEVGFVDAENAARVLSLLSFPSLQDLCLQDIAASLEPFKDPKDCDALLQHLSTTRYLQNIQCLRLDRIQASEMSTSTFLSACRLLTRLTLERVDNTVLGSMKKFHPGASDASDAAALACPHLVDLRGRDVDVSFFVECALWRASVPSCKARRLQTVAIELCGERSGDAVTDVVYEAFALMGIKLSVVEDEDCGWSRRGSLASVGPFGN